MRSLILSALFLFIACAQGEENKPLRFAKQIFRELGNNSGNVTQTVLDNQAKYDLLSEPQANQISAIFEMRAEDLRTTLEHTLRMQTVLAQLQSKKHPTSFLRRKKNK